MTQLNSVVKNLCLVCFLQMSGCHLLTYCLASPVCSPLPILSLSGVDRLSPCFSVLCELWIELVLFHITSYSVWAFLEVSSLASPVCRHHITAVSCDLGIIFIQTTLILSGGSTTGPLGPGPQAPRAPGALKFSTNKIYRT